MTNMHALDLKDKRILRELDTDARQSFSRIGKKVRLPKSVVAYRVNNLINQGIIKKFVANANRVNLGYKNCQIFLKFQNLTKEISDKFTDFIKTQKHALKLYKADGEFDFYIVISYKGIDQVNEIYSNILYKFGNYILDYQMDFVVNSYYLRNNYLYDKMIIEIDKRVANPDPGINIDKLDKLILDELVQNCRTSSVDLGVRFKTTTRTISSRIKKMKNSKIISSFRTHIDKKKLGFHQFHVFLMLSNLNKKIENELITYITHQKAAIKVFKGLGKWNLEMQLVLKDHFALTDFMDKLIKCFPNLIRKYDSILLYKSIPIYTISYSK